VGETRRDADHEPRSRKIDAERLRAIAFLRTQGRTLREIAAQVGLSHETVRTTLRRFAAEDNRGGGTAPISATGRVACASERAGSDLGVHQGWGSGRHR
jgi:transposase